MNTHELLNVKQAAEFIGTSRQWLYELIKQGKLQPERIADRQFITLSDCWKFKQAYDKKRG